MAASLATNSEHPLSKSIVTHAEDKQAVLTDIMDFKEIPGQGITGKCAKHKTDLFLGYLKLLDNSVVKAAVQALGTLGHKDGFVILIEASQNDKLNDDVRKEAMKSLEKVKWNKEK